MARQFDALLADDSTPAADLVALASRLDPVICAAIEEAWPYVRDGHDEQVEVQSGMMDLHAALHHVRSLRHWVAETA